MQRKGSGKLDIKALIEEVYEALKAKIEQEERYGCGLIPEIQS